jgi:hypothetical protein
VHGVRHPVLSFVMLNVLILDIRGHKQTLFTNFLQNAKLLHIECTVDGCERSQKHKHLLFTNFVPRA